MGRAIILILSSLILTLTLINNTEGWAAKAPDPWESFIAQYRHLVSDGKDELAERMWKNTYPKMEKYAQTLTPDEYNLWSSLTEDLNDKKHDMRFNVETIFFFLQVTSSDNSNAIIVERVHQLVRQVEQEPSTSSEIINQWKLVKPVINSYTIKEDIILVDEALSDWSIANSQNSRTAVINSLNNLVEPLKSDESEAVFWMALIVGGSITLTLSYVGARMYQGRSKNRHKLKSGSS
ncbi:Sporulation protein YpjB (SpoYpjB) [Halobacillus dabanensis]|uniref:Sporulation protein YpjB (SpoYpjB) n=1 Tax=Halobacillus dabanensis TaxID=240302 RepID=A0A1I3VXJ7_HALDA|nr:sporulation protein YpjB [Halobacillus dabanensis]SFK00088.1 Sporulation protein YpjB (SpoYpjB) [Halobacillus dabanensis]